MRILISGAGITGPVLGYWLNRAGYVVTVVELAARPRHSGGHAVDLYRPALAISQRMGVLPLIRESATGAEHLTLLPEGGRRTAGVALPTIFGASDRHVEILRDDLSEIYYGATSGDVEYIFGDQIVELSAGGDVRFERAAPRRFDLVIGADGLHSTVRRLVFGEESRFSAPTGVHLAVMTVPRMYADDGELCIHVGVGRTAGIYGVRHLGEARALFLFRSDREISPHHRDVSLQKEILRNAFRGFADDVDRWLAHLEGTSAFYFDSIAQLRMDRWSRGVVTLVGDAGYSPGPAVGGSTTLAVVGAYVLAGELARWDGDHERAYPAYERAMAHHVRDGHRVARSAARTLVPGSRFGVSGLVHATRLLSVLPEAQARVFLRLVTKSARVYDAMTVTDYDL